ncbi:MAG: hypothetical protein JXA64_02780, partial [Candidatus Fermentibacteraceae bacterium]|nr:hypothetical protein [Candidatus Fermentibacteraceae bacterium]
MNDETSILKETVEAACRMAGVDCAGIYEPESASGQFVLCVWKDIPDWFLESFARLSSMSLNDIEVPERETPSMVPTGVFPLYSDENPGSYLLVASRSPDGYDARFLPFLHWLSSLA